jgi:hypothetical protein
LRRDERPLSTVPPWLWVLLSLSLAAQIALQTAGPAGAPAAEDLPPAPHPQALRLVSLGEPQALARLLMLYVQSFDLGGANALPYRRLDYERLVGWLKAVLELDPRSNYPLFSAARVYAEVPDPVRSRVVLDFVYREFLRDPAGRWAALGHAAILAKHRLGDLPLARQYAAALARHATGPDVPLWARQMEAFVLEDMNELEAATIMLGGMLESGAVKDAGEARYLKHRLDELEARRAQKR